MASYNDNLTMVEWPALTVVAEKQFKISLMSTTADDYPFVSLHLTHRDGIPISDGTAILNFHAPPRAGPTPARVGPVRFFDFPDCHFPDHAVGASWTVQMHLRLAFNHPQGIFSGDLIGEPAATAEFTVYVTDPVVLTLEMPPPALTIEQLMATIMPPLPVTPGIQAAATQPMLFSDSPTPEDSQEASPALGSAAEPIVIEDSPQHLDALLESFGSHISGSEAPEIEEIAATGHFEEAARAIRSAPEKAVIIKDKNLNRDWP
ncbi:hypothetical protein CC79DRAFT_1398271 [Sarocladium strictum]